MVSAVRDDHLIISELLGLELGSWSGLGLGSGVGVILRVRNDHLDKVTCFFISR